MCVPLSLVCMGVFRPTSSPAAACLRFDLTVIRTCLAERYDVVSLDAVKVIVIWQFSKCVLNDSCVASWAMR